MIQACPRPYRRMGPELKGAIIKTEACSYMKLLWLLGHVESKELSEHQCTMRTHSYFSVL